MEQLLIEIVNPGEILTNEDKVRLATELENVVANLKWVSLEVGHNCALKNTWMNLEIDRRHIIRELNAGRRLAVQDESMVDLDHPFELDQQAV